MTQLHQGVQLILSALDQRAMGLTKCANFEAALYDAKLMHVFSPSPALGYIRGAAIYSEQGKQRKVIDICSRGLSMLDTKDTHYDTLQQLKMDAEQRQNTRIDFVTQLPPDIVITKLIPMLVDDSPTSPLTPSPYLFVSNAWGDRIIECYGGLRFRVGYLTNRRDEECLEVAKFARHTKQLHVSSYRQGTWLGDLLSENDFCKLRELSIDEFSSNHVAYFVWSLGSISSTLTNLTIWLPGPALRLFPMTTWPVLTTLSLTSSNTNITCDQIVAIWIRFPSLKLLTLHPCVDIQSTLIVLQYAPRISNVQLLMRDGGIQLIYSKAGQATEAAGITHLTIRSDTEDIISNTTAIIKQYHKTLEQLEWDMDDDSANRDIYNIQYPNLKKLTVNKSGWWIPRNAPILQELEVTLATIHAQPAVLLTIPPKLKKLALDLRQGLTTAAMSTIEHHLDRFARHHPLKELVINFNSNDNVGNLLEV